VCGIVFLRKISFQAGVFSEKAIPKFFSRNQNAPSPPLRALGLVASFKKSKVDSLLLAVMMGKEFLKRSGENPKKRRKIDLF
jgi:hypothetical protein